MYLLIDILIKVSFTVWLKNRDATILYPFGKIPPESIII